MPRITSLSEIYTALITHMHALIRVRLRQALIRRDTRPIDLHSTRIHMILIHTLALHRVCSLRAGQAGQTASTHGMKPTSFQHCGSCLTSPLQGDVSVLSLCVSFLSPFSSRTSLFPHAERRLCANCAGGPATSKRQPPPFPLR